MTDDAPKPKKKRRHLGVHSPTGLAKIRHHERAAHWLELRKQGLNCKQISEACVGTMYAATPSGVWEGLTRAIQDLKEEPAQAMREIELARLDQLQAAFWKTAVMGDYQSFVAVMKVIERRCRLFGLDKGGPTGPSLNVDVNVGASPMENITLEQVLPLLAAAGLEVVPKAVVVEGRGEDADRGSDPAKTPPR